MSDIKYNLLDADELGETEEETPGVTAEKETEEGEKEEELTL